MAWALSTAPLPPTGPLLRPPSPTAPSQAVQPEKGTAMAWVLSTGLVASVDSSFTDWFGHKWVQGSELSGSGFRGRGRLVLGREAGLGFGWSLDK